ncbi:MAG: anhydro-N-acetylmuramic acid kinase [Candidatus Latescibacteria bacterium]|nr:anhydro-N-acetylmuramic acid kinase [Candidatus Latescibacterota bacterium]
MQVVDEITGKPELVVIGLMSGTSVDGIDAALVRINQESPDNPSLSILAYDTVLFPDGIQNSVLEMAASERCSLDDLCRLNFVIGELFAKAACQITDKSGLRLSDVDLIGSHGQTIRHLPNRAEMFGVETGATLQIGEPSVIAQRTGVVTVGDFRAADVARGGEGAPLVPLVDFLLFRSAEFSRGLLNVGGIANLTVLPAGAGPSDVVAFDTGPGNMVIDALTRGLTGREMDRGGELARSGSINGSLLTEWMDLPYYRKAPPKSTGREMFGRAFVEQAIADGRRFKMSTSDLLATATELTVQSIFESYRGFIAPQTVLDELVVSGGGARNDYMVQQLISRFHPVHVVTSDELGMPSDAKEAVAFAVLANRTLLGRSGNLPGATGADRSAVLGKICLP